MLFLAVITTGCMPANRVAYHREGFKLDKVDQVGVVWVLPDEKSHLESLAILYPDKDEDDLRDKREDALDVQVDARDALIDSLTKAGCKVVLYDQVKPLAAGSTDSANSYSIMLEPERVMTELSGVPQRWVAVPIINDALNLYIFDRQSGRLVWYSSIQEGKLKTNAKETVDMLKKL